ncbi:MAG: SusC/RagA family TonB-linked outer membrane protein [Dysgonamonadaceae bacterium]|nr:SusC/RagA family TonB-linked outer membrane protein [Dysgonamonadaceae bacterium]
MVVNGTVSDRGGLPLIGASIAIKGTGKTTIADIDGKFSLSGVESGQTMVFSYLGFLTKEVVITGETAYEVVLEEELATLDEVVVTALGIKRAEKALSYNVQQIDAAAVTTVRDANFINSLGGKVAGLEIKSVAGGVGSSSRVTMRGVRSISQNNMVLYVIDGIPVYNYSNGNLSDEFAGETGSESIADINSDDIESISILNGAAASALYGSKAANGAILINTKKGSEGKAKFSFSNQTTFMKPFILPEFQTKYGNKIGFYESWGNEMPEPSTYQPADFFNTGVTVQNTVSLALGNKQNQTYASAAAINSGGIIPNNAYNRYNFTFRNTAMFLDDRMTLDFNFNYVKQYDRNMVSQGEYFNPLPTLYTFPRGENFEPIRAFERFNSERNIYTQFWTYGDQNLSMQNPYWLAYRNLFEHSKRRYMINPTLSYKMLDWLSIAGRLRMDNANGEHTRKLYATTNALMAGGINTEEGKGYYAITEEIDEQLYMDAILNIDKRLGDYSIQANAGASFEDTKAKRVGVGGTLKSIPNVFYRENLYQPGNLGQDWQEQTQSLFGSAEISWKSLVYLTVTGRNDWSSTLSRMPQKSFFYPSVGLSGVISDMVTLPKAISYIKIRGSWADVGGGIPRQITERYYNATDRPQVYLPVDYMPIDKLYPERTRSWEAGLDSRFFNNIMRFNVTFYKSNSFNQTLSVPVSGATGYSTMYIQTGNVMNQGVEMMLGLQPRWNRFKWESTLTASYNHNEIIDLGRSIQPDGTTVVYDQFTRATIGSMQIRLTEGGTMGDLWALTDLATDMNGNVYVDGNGNISTVSKETKCGTTLPSWKLGFNNSFSWKGITLNMLVSARLGGQVLSRTQAVLDSYGVSKASADLRDAGGKKINYGAITAETWYKTIGGKQGIYKYYIYDADNVRLQELSLGYTLPSAWFKGVMKANLSLVGRNLLMIYNKAPFDPEATSSINDYYQGIDYFMQPSVRTLGFSVKIDF